MYFLALADWTKLERRVNKMIESRENKKLKTKINEILEAREAGKLKSGKERE